MSAAWNNVSMDTIRNCFFCSPTPAVPDKPFLKFSSDEIPPSLTQETYKQYRICRPISRFSGVKFAT